MTFDAHLRAAEGDMMLAHGALGRAIEAAPLWQRPYLRAVQRDLDKLRASAHGVRKRHEAGEGPTFDPIMRGL